jgi:transcriptional regulator with XRE-family HTH domain
MTLDFHVIAQNVINLRKARRLSQSELARMSGIAQSALSQIESGERVVSLRLLDKIAIPLGSTVANLIATEVDASKQIRGSIDLMLRALDLEELEAIHGLVRILHRIKTDGNKESSKGSTVGSPSRDTI